MSYQKSRKVYIVALVLILLGFSIIQAYTALTWGMQGYYSWAVDSQGGYKILGWVKNGMRYSGWEGRYPPMHRYILAIIYTPLVLWYWLHGKIDSSGISKTDNTELRLKTVLIGIGRMVTITMALGLIVIIFRIGNSFSNPWAGLLASGLWCSSYNAVYYSMTTNLDIPYIFWSLFALERLLAFHFTRQTRLLIVSAILSALAVGTKDQAAGIILAFPILLIWSPLEKDRLHNMDPIEHRLKYALAFILISLSVYGIVSQAFWRPLNYVEHIKVVFGVGSKAYQIRMTPIEGLISYAKMFWRTMHPGICLVFIVGSMACILRAWRIFIWLAAPIITYHAVFIQLSHLYKARFTLPHLTFLAIIAGIGLTNFLKRHIRMADTIIVVLVFLACSSGLFFNVTLWNDSRQAADKWLKENANLKNNLANYCPIQPYNPTFVQINAKLYLPVNGRPIKVQEDYLILVSAYHGRFLNGAHGKDWRDLINGKRDFKVIQHFSQSGVTRNKAGIPGIAQSIFVLQKSPTGE